MLRLWRLGARAVDGLHARFSVLSQHPRSSSPRIRGILFAALTVAGFLGFLYAQGSPPHQQAAHQQTTDQRIHGSSWWPTKGSPSRKDYAGAETCARCHAREFAAQRQTSMAHASVAPPLASFTRPGVRLTLTSGSFTTSIQAGARGDTYAVARGGERLEAPIAWAFGEGVLGQTFILERDGSYFESQLSYYPSIRALDLTPGHSARPPQDLVSAFGAAMNPSDTVQCFNCHNTAATTRWQLDPRHMMLGVSCEACHGPGAKHVAAMERQDIAAGLAAILNPAALQPVDLVDFCGACHRAPLDVPAQKLVAPIDVRFQPYRLAKSRCWTRPDARITCIACHDPHQPLVQDATAYDSRCLSCHRSRLDPQPGPGNQSRFDLQPKSDAQPNSGEPKKAAAEAACPVSNQRCTSCHMPRYQVNQMHGSFTDHYIRVVRPSDPFPL